MVTQEPASDGFPLAAILDADIIAGQAAAFVAEKIGVPTCYLMILDEETDELVLKTSAGTEEGHLGRLTCRLGEGVEGWVARERAPLIIPDTEKDPRFIFHPDQKFVIKSIACVPLLAEGRLFGTLTVHRTQQGRLPASQMKQLTIWAGRIAASLRNTFLFADNAHKAREHDILMRISGELSGASVLRDAVAAMERVLPPLLEARSCRIEFTFPMRAPSPQSQCRARLADQCPAAKKKIPLVGEPPRHPVCVFRKDARLRASLCIPLITAREKIGACCLESPYPRTFNESDFPLYMAIGRAIAEGLARIRKQEDLEKRVGELSTIYEVAAYELSAVMSSSSNLKNALDLTLQTVGRLLKADRVSVMLLDGEKKELTTKAFIGPDDRPFGLDRMKVGQGIAGWAIKTGKPYIYKGPGDPIFLPSAPGQEELKALLSVPLMVENRKLGVINIGSLEAERTFTDDDLKTTALIASRAALAIENALLLEKERKSARQLAQKNTELERQTAELAARTKETNRLNKDLRSSLERLEESHRRMQTLYDITSTLGSTLELGKIFDLAVERILEVASCRSGVVTIALISPGKDALRIVASRGTEGPGAAGREMKLSAVPDDFRISVLEEKQSIFFTDMGPFKELRRALELGRTKSFYAWPLVAKDKAFGVVTLGSAQRDALPNEELMLLSAINHQVAVAIENALLYQDSLTRERDLTAFNQISNILISGDDLAERLTKISELSARLLNQEFCALALAEESGHLFLKGSWGLGREFIEAWHPKALSEIQDEVLGKGRIFRTTLEANRNEHPMDSAFLKDLGVSSLIAAPLKAGEHALGILFMGNYSPWHYSKEEIHFINLLANQMSLAIENALLYGRALLERNKVEAVVKSMGDGVMTLDWDRRITSFNQAAEEITGWDAGEALGKHCYDIAWSVDREGDRMCDKDCPFLKVTGSGESFERGLKSESLMYSKDGTPKYVSATHSVLNLGGDQAGGVMVFRDITEFKQAEQMRQDYLATISHDLKTPLTAIKGYALTLLRHGERFDYDTQREFLKVINAELDRLNRLLDNLMNLTRMEAGKLTARPQPFKLGPVMRRVSELHQVNTKDHSFVLDVRADLPLVYADQDQVEQILNNLVSNAIKYSPSGGEITLRAWAEGDQVVACVSDSGQGIARDEIPKLFKRYHRIQNRVTRKVSGTGLGLFITKTLVEAQGGSVWVESAPGKGSSFYFSLPTAQSGEKGNPEAL